MTGTYQEKVGGNSAGALKAFFDRIENLVEEKASIADDIKEVFAEAKAQGWDVKIMRIMLKRRKMPTAERLEQDALVDTYSAALGMLPADEDEKTEASD